jgi:hypothetical protein
MLFRGVCPDDVDLSGHRKHTRDCGGPRDVLDEGRRRRCGACVRYHVVSLIRVRDRSWVSRVRIG